MMDLKVLRELVEKRSGSLPARYSDTELQAIGDPLLDSELRTYLTSCLPTHAISGSGVRLLPLEAILAEISPGASPGWYLHRFDYVPIAASVGGNMIVIHAWADRRAKVYWADHSGWYEDSISYEDRSTGDWVDLATCSPQNVERALTPLARHFPEFLVALLQDELAEELKALD